MKSDIKSLLMEACHNAYFGAISAQACCNRYKPEIDVDKLDWMLTHPDVGIPIGVQLKSTHQSCIKDSHVTHTVKAKTLRKLRNRQYRCFIFLLVLPAKQPWVVDGGDSLALKHSMYWLELTGEPDLPKGQASRTYNIPVANRVTSDWLCELFKAMYDEVVAA